MLVLLKMINYAKNLAIHNKAIDAVYQRFEALLPKWIDFVKQSFLSRASQKHYIELLKERHNNLFGE